MTDRPRRPVTIATIAAEAGVSVPTVSRVLNGRSDVAPETRERIERLLGDHGYRKRSRRQTRVGLVDLVFNDLDSPWALEIIRGAEDAAQSVGLGTVVSAVHRHPGSTRTWLDNLRTRGSDAVVLVTSDLDVLLRSELGRLDLPVVVIDPGGAADLQVPTIGATNWSGAVAATEHLVAAGHRRIGHVAGQPGLWSSRSRVDGYRAGLGAAGIEAHPELVVEGDFGYASGHRAAARLLALDDPPTAVFAASDQMALGVYEAARKAGRRVPDDLSVVGFDDLPEAQWSSPPLTTVHQPLSDMGALGVRTALRLLEDQPVDTPRVELATHLVVRESTAAVDTAGAA